MTQVITTKEVKNFLENDEIFLAVWAATDYTDCADYLLTPLCCGFIVNLAKKAGNSLLIADYAEDTD
jgi:hypothetical protein